MKSREWLALLVLLLMLLALPAMSFAQGAQARPEGAESKNEGTLSTPSPTPPLPGATPSGTPANDQNGGMSVAYQVDAAHSGNLSNSRLKPPLHQVWSIDLGGEAISHPLVVDGKVYVVAGIKLYALDPFSGATIWGPVELGDPYWFSRIAYDRGQIFAINYGGLLQAFNSQTGALNWSTQVADRVESDLVAYNGRVYVTTSESQLSESQLYAIEELNGKVLWTVHVGGRQGGFLVVSQLGVFVTFSCGQAYAYEADTGQLLWNSPPNSFRDCYDQRKYLPALYNGNLYMPYTNGEPSVFTLFEANTGKAKSDFVSEVNPAFDGNVAFVISGGALQATDVENGSILWTFTGDSTFNTSPIVINGVVYAGSTGGHLFGVDASTGKEVFSDTLPVGVTSPTDPYLNLLVGLGADADTLFVPASAHLVAFANGATPSTPTPTPDLRFLSPSARMTALASYNRPSPSKPNPPANAGLPYTSLFTTALNTMMFFFLTFVPVVIVSVPIFASSSWAVVKRYMVKQAVLLYLVNHLGGVLSLLVGLMFGLYIYALVGFLLQIAPVQVAAADILTDMGRVRVFAFLLATLLVSGLVAAFIGAFEWLLIRKRIPDLSPQRWVIGNSLFWSCGFVGSLAISLVGAAILQRTPAALIIYLCGGVMGVLGGKRLATLAKYAQPPGAEPARPILDPPFNREETNKPWRSSQPPGIDKEALPPNIDRSVAVRLQGDTQSTILPRLLGFAALLSAGVLLGSILLPKTPPPRLATPTATVLALGNGSNLPVLEATPTTTWLTVMSNELVARGERNFARAVVAEREGRAGPRNALIAEAISNFDEALAQEPSLAIAYYDRALCYMLSGKRELAKADLRQAIAFTTDVSLRQLAQDKLTELESR